MNSVERIGKLLRPPNPHIGMVTGEVIQKSPLKVRINDYIVAQYPKLFYVRGLTFERGDRVIVGVSDDNQIFYVLGKAVRA